MSEKLAAHTLQFPIVLPARHKGGSATTISEIVLRRPTAGDVRSIDSVKGEIAKATVLIAKLSGLDRATIDKVDIADFEKLAVIVGDFTPGSATDK